jgi:membrane protease YdiL (CAAX protease family)
MEMYMKIDKSSKGFLYIINTSLELVIAVSAIVMFKIGKVNPIMVFNQAQPIWIQAAIGAAAGLLLGLLCGLLVTRVRFFSPVLEMVDELVIKYKLNVFDIIMISLIAGVCEELLFRGALQRVWGIWPTSVLFILLHGYFNPRNLKIMAYGVLMLALSALIGYSYKYIGLYAAVVFHFIFDCASLIIVMIAVNKTAAINGTGSKSANNFSA